MGRTNFHRTYLLKLVYLVFSSIYLIFTSIYLIFTIIYLILFSDFVFTVTGWLAGWLTGWLQKVFKKTKTLYTFVKRRIPRKLPPTMGCSHIYIYELIYYKCKYGSFHVASAARFIIYKGGIPYSLPRHRLHHRLRHRPHHRPRHRRGPPY